MKYWEERQKSMYEAGEMRVNEYFRRLEKSFNHARRELQKTIDSFYLQYADENGLSLSDAQKELEKAEIGELRDYIGKVMASIGKHDQEVSNLSIKARITRYQALEAQVDAILQQLYAVDYEKFGKETMQEIYTEAYYETWFNIDQYHGFHQEFAQINPLDIEKLIEYPFNGADFSSRLWKQKDHLQTQLMESITVMLVQGTHPSVLTRDFAKKMQAKKFDAYRLLHTEGSFLISESTHAAYREDGVERYQIIATLDSKTCGICGDLDNDVFQETEAVTGVNKPPFHPLCRCTDVPHYGEEDLEGEKRAARDPKTGKVYEVPADMSYREWKKVVEEGGDFATWKKSQVAGSPKIVLHKDDEKNPERLILSSDEVIEQAKLYGAELEKDISLLKYDNGYPISNYLNEKLGYDKKPRVVSSQEFERFKEEGKTILYRGVTDYKEISAHDMVEQFKYGNFYCGRGIYGYGTYTDTNKAVANYYAYDSGITDNGEVMEMILTDDAKVVDYLEIFTEYEKREFPKL